MSTFKFFLIALAIGQLSNVCSGTTAADTSLSKALRFAHAIHLSTTQKSIVFESKNGQPKWVICRLSGTLNDKPIVLYWIDNLVFSDFCFFESVETTATIIQHFRARWTYLRNGINLGLISHLEAGGVAPGELEMMIAGGWEKSKNGNIVLNGIRAAEIERYVEELGHLSEPTASKK